MPYDYTLGSYRPDPRCAPDDCDCNVCWEDQQAWLMLAYRITFFVLYGGLLPVTSWNLYLHYRFGLAEARRKIMAVLWLCWGVSVLGIANEIATGYSYRSIGYFCYAMISLNLIAILVSSLTLREALDVVLTKHPSPFFSRFVTSIIVLILVALAIAFVEWPLNIPNLFNVANAIFGVVVVVIFSSSVLWIHQLSQVLKLHIQRFGILNNVESEPSKSAPPPPPPSPPASPSPDDAAASQNYPASSENSSDGAVTTLAGVTVTITPPTPANSPAPVREVELVCPASDSSLALSVSPESDSFSSSPSTPKVSVSAKVPPSSPVNTATRSSTSSPSARKVQRTITKIRRTLILHSATGVIIILTIIYRLMLQNVPWMYVVFWSDTLFVCWVLTVRLVMLYFPAAEETGSKRWKPTRGSTKSDRNTKSTAEQM